MALKVAVVAAAAASVAAHGPMHEVKKAATSAEVTALAVDYVVDGEVYEGYLAMPAAATSADSLPAMLIAPAWYGLGTSEMVRAEEAAMHGYIAMGLDMYGKGKRATDSASASALKSAIDANLPLQQAIMNTALAQLLPGGALGTLGGPTVDEENIYMIGYCAGGVYTTEFARAGAPLKAISLFHSNFRNLTAYPDMSTLSVQVHHAQFDNTETDETLVAFGKTLDAHNTKVWETITYSGQFHGFTDIQNNIYNERAATQAHNSMFSFFAGLMPEKAGTVPTCEPGWYKMGDPSKNCAWVAEYAEKRCDAKGWNKALASESCPCTCR